MNIRRRAFICLFVLFLVLTAVSCTQVDKKGITNKNDASTQSDDSDVPVLKIYLFPATINAPFFSNTITTYNNTFKDIKIQGINKGYLEYKNIISTELMAGEGPDLIIVDNNISAGDNTIGSIRKYFEAGAFCDFNEIISESKDFSMTDYYSSVMDSGVYKGKRYLIPVRFYIPAVFTYDKNLKNNNIEINPSDWNLEGMLKTSEIFAENNSGEEKYLLDNDLFTAIITSNINNFINYENKKSNFNSTGLKDFLDLCKKIYPVVCPDKTAEKYGGKYKMLSNGTCVMINSGNINPWCRIQGENDTDLRIYTIPSIKADTHIFSQPVFSIGINSRCLYKQKAFEYIKLLLNDNNQMSKYTDDAPVSKKAYKETAYFYISNLNNKWDLPDGTSEITKEEIKAGTIEQMTDLEKLIDCQIVDGNIAQVVMDALQNFLNGDISSDKAAKIIDQKVSLFLNE